MSVSRYGPTCEPARDTTDHDWIFRSFGAKRTPAPTHDGCPGGETREGLLGGWTCVCSCHSTEQVDLRSCPVKSEIYERIKPHLPWATPRRVSAFISALDKTGYTLMRRVTAHEEPGDRQPCGCPAGTHGRER